jgi:hypothetical protein
LDATVGSASLSGTSASGTRANASKASGSRAGYRLAGEASGSARPDWMTLADAVWGEENHLATKPASAFSFRRRP